MTIPGLGPVGSIPAPARDPDTALRSLSHQFEGVFLAQLFQVMRQSVPAGGVTASDPGQAMFTGMLDDRLAALAAERSTRGIGDALYRQLSRHLHAQALHGGATGGIAR